MPDAQAQFPPKEDTTGAPQDVTRLDVSVVIPCLNEANSLAFCVEKAISSFRNAGLRGEVIVADNGSTDGSIEIAEFNGARVLRVPERGYGAALKAGIAAARGEFVIMGDADDSYDFGEVPNFVNELRCGNDLVMGNRFLGGIKRGAMPPLHKYFGNPGLSWLVNVLFRAGVGDSYCGMRGFSRALYDKLDLRSSGMEFALEFVIKATQIGARISEIPIILWPDKRGRPPHLRSFRDGWRSLRFMLLYAPNWLYLVPGGSLLACGLGAWLRISRTEWAIIAFTIALVLILEGLNTAVEAAVDLSSPNFHPLAKAAKDLAAAMVLIASIASLAVGLLILGPPLWSKLFK